MASNCKKSSGCTHSRAKMRSGSPASADRGVRRCSVRRAADDRVGRWRIQCRIARHIPRSKLRAFDSQPRTFRKCAHAASAKLSSAHLRAPRLASGEHRSALAIEAASDGHEARRCPAARSRLGRDGRAEPALCAAMREYFRDVSDHQQRLNQTAESIRDMITTAI